LKAVVSRAAPLGPSLRSPRLGDRRGGETVRFLQGRRKTAGARCQEPGSGICGPTVPIV
jgi:hypothetical protein